MRYMPSANESTQSDSTRKPGAYTRKQAATWLTPEQIKQVRDACLTNVFQNHLQGRNKTIITVLADTGLRVSEFITLDWDHVDLDADPAELYLPGGIQKETKRDAYLDLEDETGRQLRRYQNGAWKTIKSSVPKSAV